MPHQCAACDRVFADGSKEMLSGCPDCGGNKFQFIPHDHRDETHSDDSSGSHRSRNSSPSPNSPADSGDGMTGRPNERSSTPSESGSPNSYSVADSERDATATGSTEGSPQEANSETDSSNTTEDSAQASARSDVVDPDELPRSSDSSVDHPNIDTDSSTAEPGLSELRDELNSQFESIKIVNPGEYELNLMELYNRQEYIISLQENGRYVIDMPNSSGIDND